MKKISDSIIHSNDEGFIQISGATSISSGRSKGSLTVILTRNASKRVRLSGSLLDALDNPESVNVLSNGMHLFICVDNNGNDSIKVGKGGVLYSTPLADTIIKISGSEFPENASTRA